MKKIRLFCQLLAMGLCASASAQNFTQLKLDSLAGSFSKQLLGWDAQKIIFQTDRNAYVAGEDLWFKAFLLRCINNRLDTMSKNLFVDLVDDQDNVIIKLVLNAAHLRTGGTLHLSDTLKTGIYWLRSYTQLMIDKNASGIYVQPILVKNLVDAKSPSNNPAEKQVNATPVIKYFAEGGSLVTNINSAGALLVTDSLGNRMVAEGDITDSKTSIITHFKTNKYGLTRIDFEPLPTEKYFAVIKSSAGTVKYPLPGYNPYAAQLAITSQRDDAVKAYVALEDALNKPGFTTYILGISGDSICFSGVGKGLYNLEIPLQSFPGGMATLLLFDDKMHVLSERKIFINRDNYRLTIKPAKGNYAARDEVRVNIELADENNTPLIASLSIAVQDNRIMGISDELNAQTSLPANPFDLGDWLKQNKNSLSSTEIDLLMMAQYQFYTNWTNMANNTGRNEDSTDLLANLKGIVVNFKGKPLANRVVSAVSFYNVNPYFGVDTTKEAGSFKLPLPENTDSLVFKIQVTNHDNKEDDSIIVNNFVFPKLTTPPALKQRYTTSNTLALSNLKTYYIDTFFTAAGKEWLRPVVVKSTIKKQFDYDESKRVSSFSYILSGDKLGHGAPDEIFNQLLMIPGVSLIQDHLVIFGISNFQGGSEPLLIIDGIAMQSQSIKDALNALNFRTVDFIEVLRGGEASNYGNRGANGVIIINSKSRPNILTGRQAGFTILQPSTYHTPGSFPMPDYTNTTVKNSKVPDGRTTIYWKTDIITNTQGKAFVDFYTADEATAYSITVTGLAANGEYVYKKIILNRK